MYWRVADRIDEVDAKGWDALVPGGNPFVRFAFLNTLEQSGSVCADLGWQPFHLLGFEGDQLVAAAPAYLKHNSHGEFVFDWHWADASHRSGIPYYPKLLVGVPYSPVPGPRLLFDATYWRDAATAHRALRQQIESVVDEHALSGAHINFHLETERAHDPRWIERLDWQYHWHNRNWRDFDDFLDALSHKKRKNIRQERRKLADTGWTFRQLSGLDATDADIDLMFRCYRTTFREKGNTAALTHECFVRMCAAPELGVRLVQAWHDGEACASALLMEGGGRLYGRYWGALRDAPGLHFETCYYQGIAYAIAAGVSVFEPGAQGEHKLARGFLPVRTWSSHRLAHPGLHGAVARHVVSETEAQEHLGVTLAAESPFRAEPSA